MFKKITRPVLDLLKQNKFVARIFFPADARSRTARNNILYSLFYKVFGTFMSFVSVPLTLKYLHPTKYGVWLTLSAVISWINLFDIGLGNGLRNKFAEALAKGDRDKARIYVSTTYAILTLIVIGTYALFLVANQFIDWNALLNVSYDVAGELRPLAHLIFVFFLLRLLFGLIIPVLTADQNLGAVGLIELLVNLFALLVVIVLPHFIDNSLLWVGGSISFITSLIPAIASLYYFNFRYRDFAPAMRFVNFNFFKDLMNLSVDFFLLSISTIIIYFSQNLIISHLFDPAEVTTFNIVYKYFFYVVILQVLILNPMLPAATESFFKGELQWIKRTLKKLIYLWMGITVMVILMIVFSDFVYRVWIGDQVKIPFRISLAMGLYIIVFTWYATFAYLINGIGKIKLQLYIVLTASFFVVPLSIFLVKNLHFGVEGVIFAGLISTLPGSVIIPVQLYKILNNKATGVWNR